MYDEICKFSSGEQSFSPIVVVGPYQTAKMSCKLRVFGIRLCVLVVYVDQSNHKNVGVITCTSPNILVDEYLSLFKDFRSFAEFSFKFIVIKSLEGVHVVLLNETENGLLNYVQPKSWFKLLSFYRMFRVFLIILCWREFVLTNYPISAEFYFIITQDCSWARLGGRCIRLFTALSRLCSQCIHSHLQISLRFQWAWSSVIIPIITVKTIFVHFLTKCGSGISVTYIFLQSEKKVEISLKPLYKLWHPCLGLIADIYSFHSVISYVIDNSNV